MQHPKEPSASASRKPAPNQFLQPSQQEMTSSWANPLFSQVPSHCFLINITVDCKPFS